VPISYAEPSSKKKLTESSSNFFPKRRTPKSGKEKTPNEDDFDAVSKEDEKENADHLVLRSSKKKKRLDFSPL